MMTYEQLQAFKKACEADILEIAQARTKLAMNSIEYKDSLAKQINYKVLVNDLNALIRKVSNENSRQDSTG